MEGVAKPFQILTHVYCSDTILNFLGGMDGTFHTLHTLHFYYWLGTD